MSEKGYTPLQLGKEQQVEDFIVEIEEVDEVQEDDDQTQIDDTSSDEVEQESTQQVPDKERKVEERKPSRAEKRIKELHTKNKEYEAKLQEAMNEIENFKKITSESSKMTKAQQKNLLEDQIKNLNARFVKAMEEGDPATTVEVQNELVKAQTQLFQVSNELDNFQEYQPQKSSPVNKQSNNIPEKALEWIDSYPAFRTDEVFQASAVAVNNRLLQEGWDPESDEFYEEVTTRLEKRFPEVFGETTQNSVQSNKADESSPTTTEKLATEEQSKKKTPRYTEQTVSGASRTPSVTSDGRPSTSKKNSIELNQHDAAIISKWGIKPKDFAKKKLALQNKERGQYIPIFSEE